MRACIWLAAALAAGLGFAPRAAAAGKATSQPAAPDAAAPDAGADRLYRRYCASCHGDDFTGSDWREFKPEIPDFTRAAWHTERSDDRLLASILEGKGSGMPSFRRKLSEGQARALVARLRRAAPDFVPGRPRAGEPDDFDRRFEELSEEMERLKKAFYESGRMDEPAPSASAFRTAPDGSKKADK